MSPPPVARRTPHSKSRGSWAPTLSSSGMASGPIVQSHAPLLCCPQAIVRAMSDGGGGGGAEGSDARHWRPRPDRSLGWSTGPDYLLVLRARHCQTVGLYELREEAKNGLLVGNSALQVRADGPGGGLLPLPPLWFLGGIDDGLGAVMLL